MDRTGARVAAMKLLYAWEIGGDGGEETKAGLLEIEPFENESDFVDALVMGVRVNLSEVDALIERYADGWRIDRLHKIDLTILRIAVYELIHNVTPRGVAINEAIEMAHTYSTPESGPFINGVLGSMARDRDDA